MEYTIDDRPGAEPAPPAVEVAIGGAKHRGAAAKGFRPAPEDDLGSVRAWRGKRKSMRGNRLAVGKRWFKLHPPARKPRFFARNAGWLHVRDRAGLVQGYVAVLRVRKLAVAACTLALCAAALLAVALTQGVPAAEAPTFLADQAGIAKANGSATSTVQYAAYESTPDQVWAAGQTAQRMHLSLPATVASADGDGEESYEANPVVAAPHIYVDLNGDGAFAEDELVFNPLTYDDTGNVADWGKFLEPGRSIDEIELTRPVDAGTYAARTTWTPLTRDGLSQANPMSFDWELTVE